ncbi:unnamed protein product [Sphacelaria rigidula]
MAGSSVEAKSICVRKLEDLLVDPMFTIFHVQHAQIAAKTETNNSLIYHLQCSMAKVRHWNSTTVRDFCANLVTRFPVLGDTFSHLFRELQELTYKILNESSDSSSYAPMEEETHTILHSFISACSDAFIAHTQWFAVEESSTEFQSCKNNAKIRMQQANIVDNTVMNFVKAGPKEEPMIDNTVVPRAAERYDDDDMSFMSERSHGSHSSQRSHDSQRSQRSHGSKHSQDSNKSISSKGSDMPGKKSIDLVSGSVQDETLNPNPKPDTNIDEEPQFSTPFADAKVETPDTQAPSPTKKTETVDSEFESESASSDYDTFADYSTDDYTEDSDESLSDDLDDNEDSENSESSSSDDSDDYDDSDFSYSDDSDSSEVSDDSDDYDDSDFSYSDDSDSSEVSDDSDEDSDEDSNEDSDEDSDQDYSDDSDQDSDEDYSDESKDFDYSDDSDMIFSGDNASDKKREKTMQVPVDMLSRILSLQSTPKNKNKNKKRRRSNKNRTK